MTRYAFVRALAILGCSASLVQAEVRLHHLFSDHMVLQRGTQVPIWGWADEGEKVTVEFRGNQYSTKANKDGEWRINLPKLEAGSGERMRVFGDNGDRNKRQSSIVVFDVAVGEVWVASGQSNMEWPLRASANPSNDIAQSANENIRLFTVPKLKLGMPTNNVNGKWVLSGPETVPGFSAVGYFFARDLQKALGVPVGLIHTSWGGSPAEVWMSEEVLYDNPEYRRNIVYKHDNQLLAYDKSYTKWLSEREAAQSAGQAFTKRAPNKPWAPSELYNGMIANIIPYGIQGAIWYQGESNAGRAWEYRRLFQDMIRNWRNDWNRDFTFLAVQLAPWDKSRNRPLEQITAQPGDSDWAELREAQWLATRELDKVGMAVITDVGEKDDIHPRQKEPVGARLALLARDMVYDHDIVANGPEFRRVKFNNGHATISFKHVDGGLEARGGELRGFSIAGEDGKFVWANAVIKGDQVVVSSPSVPQPKAVRYGWADFPVVNLFNKAGLPATPFRTDDWPMVTQPKPAPVAAAKAAPAKTAPKAE